MSQFTVESLNRIVERHREWINDGMKMDDDRRANLSGAYLRGAYLRGADLRGADLRGADLRGAVDTPFIPMACPDAGQFVGWKKCRENRIVKLLILNDAKRSSATSRKCRCDKARVLAVESLDGKVFFDHATSTNDGTFVYRVGETVSVSDFCDDRWDECAPGIHFFINRKEAEMY